MAEHYEVEVYERWARTIAIKSEEPLTKQQLQNRANEMISSGEGEICFEYSDTTEPDTWPVKRVNEDGEVLDWLDF